MEQGRAVDEATEACVMDGLDFFVAGIGLVCSGAAIGWRAWRGACSAPAWPR
ncbi:hypothetical protein ACP70R_000507 [Stipagrostis hirtigluma subsp. patula]